MISNAVRLRCVLIAIAAAFGCDSPVDIEVDAGPPPPAFCENDEDCGGGGQLCVAGSCVIGLCNPGVEATCGIETPVEARDEACCKFFENCNAISLTCERDPTATGIGCPPGEDSCTPCAENNDCATDPDFGFSSFCSGGRCFKQAGRADCNQDFQCPAGERCDTTEFLCVPDSGACRFCSEEFPELCCATGSVCDTVSGSCLTIPDAECTVETSAVDCARGLKCDTLGRCVQCADTSECGPNTTCNPASGLCESNNRCEEDAECGNPLLKCIANQCNAPACTADEDCRGFFGSGDERKVCENDACILPPAQCTETDEPNNTLETATAVALATGYGGKICRGDLDILTLPVTPGKRYSVRLTVVGASFAGLSAELLDTTGASESRATWSSDAAINLIGVSGLTETGSFSLRISAGAVIAADQWSYTVVIAEAVASPEADCSAASNADEPGNNVFATATELVLGQATSTQRCGIADADIYKITVPAQNGVTVLVDGFENAEGNLNVQIFKGATAGDLVISSSTATNVDTITAPESNTTFYFKVSLASAAGSLANQSYRLTATAVPRPAACDADVGENDGTVTSARELLLTGAGTALTGSAEALRCNAQDVDNVRFTVPAGAGGTVRINFTHSQGDMRLDLLREDGTAFTPARSANASTLAIGAESIDLPVTTTPTSYIARASLATASGSTTIGQAYTLVVSTYDNGVCAEAVDDSVLSNAPCVGDFSTATTAPQTPLRDCVGVRLRLPLVNTLGECADAAAAGCGLVCGIADSDLYRVGPLTAGQSVELKLEFDAAAGDIDVVLGKVTNATTTTLTTVRTFSDVAATAGTITGTHVVTASNANGPGDYYIKVTPTGAPGHEAQPYALSAAVSAPCLRDVYEGSASATNNGNATAATSTLLRDNPTPLEPTVVVSDATVCSGDFDVYEFLALANETITITLNDVVGATLKVGVRPAALTSVPSAMTSATPTVSALTPSPANATVGAATPATVTFTSLRAQQMFIVVDRTTNAGVGPYTLSIDVGGPDAPR